MANARNLVLYHEPKTPDTTMRHLRRFIPAVQKQGGGGGEEGLGEEGEKKGEMERLIPYSGQFNF